MKKPFSAYYVVYNAADMTVQLQNQLKRVPFLPYSINVTIMVITVRLQINASVLWYYKIRELHYLALRHMYERQ